MSSATSETGPAALLAPAGVPVLNAEGIAKSYGPTRAITSASLRVAPGEIHALAGENGSGKSTLVKIVSGVQQPDAGALAVHGREIGAWPDPRAAGRAGITAVYQEVLTVPERDLSENVWLGAEGVFRPGPSAARRRERAREVLGLLLDPVPSLDVPVGRLSLSQRQAVCLCRALLRDPDLLVLDEATSALDVETRDRLFAVLRERSRRGKAVLFISHRMDEIEEIADRVTVMRSGETVACLDRGPDRAARLVELMSGAQQQAAAGERARAERGSLVLSARDLVLEAGAPETSFELRAGEIVGLAGLEGHGQSEFLSALAGAAAHAGTVTRHGDPDVVLAAPETAAAHGVAYVPRERRAESLFESLSIRDNFVLPTVGHDRRFGLVRHGLGERRLRGYVDKMRIRLSRPDAPISTLSGGNQQKIVIARWLAAGPSVLLLDDPTRGIDIGAKRDVYRILAELAASGVAVVMVSTDLDEQLELMHRVVVFREKAVFRSFDRPEMTRDRLVGAFFGRAA